MPVPGAIEQIRAFALTVARLPCHRLVMAINLLAGLSLEQLRRAVAIKEQIAALEADLSQILGVPSSVTSVGNRRGRRKKGSSSQSENTCRAKDPVGEAGRGTPQKPRRQKGAGR